MAGRQLGGPVDTVRPATARRTNGFLAADRSRSWQPDNDKKTRCENQRHLAPCRRSFLAESALLIGYIRVSKSDGSQTLAPQRDALLAAIGPSAID